MTAVDELIGFLRAQLDGEAELAHRLGERYRVRNPDRADDGQPYWPLPTVEARFRDADPDIAAGLELIKAYNPQRVLAEVKVKRERIDWIEVELGDDADNETVQWLAKIEARPYAGRPGWREEWSA